jgi:hypothetical protein
MYVPTYLSIHLSLDLSFLFRPVFLPKTNPTSMSTKSFIMVLVKFYL